MIDHYITAKVEVNGSTHIGQVVDDVCVAICNYAQHPILLPVADGEVECLQCLRIMRHRGITINTTVKLVTLNDRENKRKTLQETVRET